MLELPTYTSLFALERRLYAVYDIELPVPVSLTQVVAFAVGVAAMAITLGLLGVSFAAATAWLYLVPPATLAWASSRPLIEAKRPHRLALSYLRFAAEPRVLVALKQPHERRAMRVLGRLARPPKGGVR